jgi:putative two-component system response regulator
MRKTVFVVDDVATNLTMAVAALESQYRILTMQSASRMFTILEKVMPDMILLDVEMPEMDGFETLKKLKAHATYSSIPVIFLTGITNEETEAQGFELGVVDFITKPFSAPVLQNRIKTHLDIDELIRARTAQLDNLKNSTISVLADMVETRDKNTGGHIERTSAYVEILIRAMLKDNIYIDEIKDWNIEMVVSSSRLHDIGKIAISDLILNKPCRLTTEEFELIKTHAVAGEKIIDQIIMQTGSEMFLWHAKLFAGYHHERWDGTGYPYGLQEKEIPLQGRIMAIVDVYDALMSDRPYKAAFTAAETIDIIMNCENKHFDPLIAETFYKSRSLFGGER